MATLAQQRAAIAAGMRASRQATSEASRRATGEAIVSRRTGRDEVDDLNAVISQPRQRTSLRSVEPRGSVPALVGRGNYAAPPATGGGIASPLVEPTASTREYYDPVLLPTTDGLAWVRWRSVKKFVMQDANDDEVILEFANGVS
ncbi:hypothetical protein EGJ86_07230 [Pseudomonas sp. o96-267]|uniref:hypothetical protein n=1 Tax=Pseudomonas sp. o96-267 TaxID=2479853 RepID=UPI000F7919DD|nr:hypothetical protein [Pseudomonas sp. o96-267]RRV41269.1 hypothetical protein EGJ86_07230 [Pseudomonas sp. o96-267]